MDEYRMNLYFTYNISVELEGIGKKYTLPSGVIGTFLFRTV